jgi:hypothetical protein
MQSASRSARARARAASVAERGDGTHTRRHGSRTARCAGRG